MPNSQLVSLIALALTSVAWAGPVVEPPRPQLTEPAPELLPARSRWREFDLFGIYSVTSGGGNSKSLGVAWRPEFWGEGIWQVFGQFGFSLLYARRKTYPVPALSLQMFGACHFRQWYGAIGAGTETWIDYGGTAPTVSWQVGYELSDAHLTRIFLTYSPVFFTQQVSQFRFGLGLNF